ncbi:hypothetical protein DMC01_09840 [Campylobacter troglodytis]|nr:hypothetical protein DMC01_09840 [Campylobacter troglodytis]
MKHKLKYYFFLFRWFLIGRYHCDFTQITITKQTFYFLHKFFWSFIIFSVVLSFSAILDFFCQF